MRYENGIQVLPPRFLVKTFHEHEYVNADCTEQYDHQGRYYVLIFSDGVIVFFMSLCRYENCNLSSFELRLWKGFLCYRQPPRSFRGCKYCVFFIGRSLTFLVVYRLALSLRFHVFLMFFFLCFLLFWGPALPFRRG